MRKTFELLLGFLIFVGLFVATSYVPPNIFTSIQQAADDYNGGSTTLDIKTNVSTHMSSFTTIFQTFFGICAVGFLVAIVLSMAFPTREEYDYERWYRR